MMIRSFIPITLGSAVGFQCFNSSLDLDYLPAPPGKYAGSERHRWRNAATSLVNSAIIASIAVYCLYSDRNLWNYPDTYYTVSADVCVAIISGYLIYDTYDLMTHNHFVKVWSVIVHHLILIFGILVLSMERLAMGGILISLLCEFSAIFLHSRLLLLMYGFSKDSLVYGVHRVFNLLTFVLLRLPPIMYATYITYTTSHLPAYLAVSLAPLSTVVVAINCALLWRLLCSDFLTKGGRDVIMDN